MPVRQRLVLLACLTVVTPTTAVAGETENWARLKAMPRERRVALAKNLERFDALDRDDRAQILKLDEYVAGRSPTEQAHFRTVLRRYHLWVQSLPDDQKEQLRRSQPGRERMILVARLHASQQVSVASASATPLSVQILPVVPIPVVDCAGLLKDWLALTPDERAGIEKRNPRPPELINAARKAAGTRVERIKPFQELPDADQATLLRNLEAELKTNVDVVSWLRARMDTAKEGNTEKALKKEAINEKGARKAGINAGLFKRHVAENYYFLRRPPKSVSPENLGRFVAAMPALLRPSLDMLPPDEARRRVTVLYRLVYPHPQEMPVPKPATTPAKGAPAKPAVPAAAPKGAPPAATPQPKPGAPAPVPKQNESPF